MITEAQHDLIRQLRNSGLVVIVMSQEEVHESGLNVDELHNALQDVVSDAHWRICRQDDNGLPGDELAEKYGTEAEHPQYTREDFVLDKGFLPQSDLAYWDWVASELS